MFAVVMLIKDWTYFCRVDVLLETVGWAFNLNGTVWQKYLTSHNTSKNRFSNQGCSTSNDIPEHQETFLRRAYEWLAAAGIVLSSILGIYSVIIVVGFILFSIGRLFDKLLFPAMGKIAAFCMAVVVGFTAISANICRQVLLFYEIDCDGKTGDVLGKQEFISNFEGNLLLFVMKMVPDISSIIASSWIRKIGPVRIPVKHFLQKRQNSINWYARP